jgi:hypothetical protein
MVQYVLLDLYLFLYLLHFFMFPWQNGSNGISITIYNTVFFHKIVALAIFIMNRLM